MKGSFLFIRYLFLLLFIVAIQWVSFPAHQVYAANNTYYVAKTGNDNNPGTLAQPWLTISKAARTIVAGDTVNIQAGTYNEKVSPSNSGTAGSPITYQNYNGQAVIIDGTGLSLGAGGLFDIANKNYITVSGLQIQNAGFSATRGKGGQAYGVWVYGNCDHITLSYLTITQTGYSGIGACSNNWTNSYTVKNLTIDHCTLSKTNSGRAQECISLTGVNTAWITHNLIHDSWDSIQMVGIDTKVGSTNMTIAYNEIDSATTNGAGIYIGTGHSANYKVYSNYIHNLGSTCSGIAIAEEGGGFSCTDYDIFNNIITDCYRGIVFNWGPAYNNNYLNMRVYNNTLYNNRASELSVQVAGTSFAGSIARNNIIYNTLGKTPISLTSQWTQDHNLTTNPLFVNAGAKDFHLQAGSAALDKGSSTGAPTSDYNNNTRPQGAGFDIGVYEYSSDQQVVLDHITVSPSSTSVAAGGSQTYTAQGYDSSNNPINGLTYTWSVNNPAAGSISASGVFTPGTVAGSYPNVIQAVSGGKTGTASVTIIMPILDHINISPSNTSISTQGSVNYTAQGYDSSNNPISGLSYTWSVASTSAGSISSSGVFTAGMTTDSYPNVIQATSGGKTGTASITVMARVLDHITVIPNNASIRVGANQNYNAQGYDSNNNPISGLTYTWSISNSVAGSVNSNGVFTAGNTAGSYSNVIRAVSGSKTGTASVTVTAVPLDHITVSPSSASLAAGGSQTYTAQGYDSNNNPINGLTYTWSISNSVAGSVNSNGVFTAGNTAGSYSNVIRAVSGSKTGTASVTVTAVPLDHITVSPSSASLAAGGSQTYTAQGYDSNNNPVNGLTYTWSVTDPIAGSINSSGLFATGTTAGNYPDVIQASSDGKRGTASVIVSQPKLAWDINKDGIANVQELILISQHMEESGSPGWIPEDVNSDGVIDVLDMIVINQHWAD